MKHRFGQLGALLLAALLCLQCATPALAAQDSGTVTVSSAEDLLALAKHCSLDTWSQGRTVILTQDISLSGADFAPIPTFGGVFDGGGHTISGLKVTGSYSPAGLFGIVQEGAEIRNLYVSGTVTPGGKGGETGGIAGRNSGLIANCSFSGSVAGDNSVGGVAGVNQEAGKLQNCAASGTVSGKSMTGGVAGKNLGVVDSCQNQCMVNTESVDPGVSLDDLDLSATDSLFTLRAMDTINVATDTGGVVGYSSGLVLGCSNSGTVGYPHIGYNVGGIVGRSCGHVANCANHGAVLGRKDVGGVVGQAEPDIILTLTEDNLQRMQGELDRLNTMVNQMVNSTQNTAAEINTRLEDIGESIGTAGGHTRELARLIADYSDSTLTEIDRGSDIFSNAMGRLADISRDMPALSDTLAKGLEQMEAAVRELARLDEFTGPMGAELNTAADELAAAGRLMNSGTEKVMEGMRQLAGAVEFEDEEAAKEALDTIQDGAKELNTAMENVSDALQKLMDCFTGENTDWDQVSEALGELRTASGEVSAAVDAISQGVAMIRDNLTFDMEKGQAGLATIQEGMSMLGKAMERIQAAVGHAQNAFAQMDGISAQMKWAMDTLAGALGSFAGASNQGTGIFTQMEALFDYLTSVDPIQIAHPSEEIGNSANALFDVMEQLQAQMSALNGTSNAATGSMADSIRAISAQMGRVTGALTDAVYQAESPSVGDSFSDTSPENVDAVTSGKIFSCTNSGNVYGDIGVGGVAGAMAVEYELDPEDDLATDAPARRREYELKVILQNCSNTGSVTGRRDYVGAVCGQTELGLITGCQGYGSAESENGGHVGGIAGTAAGAIAGGEGGTLTGNLFVSEELAGTSRVSVSGQAEPAAYEDLISDESAPEPFRQLTLRFWADGQMVKEVPFRYGDSFGADVFPAILTREGRFARWDKSTLDDLRFDTDVTAIYSPYISALESEAKREDGRSVFLAEGLFQESDMLSAAPGQKQGATPLPQGTGTVLERWRLDIPEDGQSIHTVRYLAPSGAEGKLFVYALEDGDWRVVEAEMFGSYLMFETNGSFCEVVIVESPLVPWVGLVGTGVVFAVGCIVWMVKKHRRKVPNALNISQ